MAIVNRDNFYFPTHPTVEIALKTNKQTNDLSVEESMEKITQETRTQDR